MKPLEKTKPNFSPRTNLLKYVNTSKDVKGKGKVVSEPKISFKGSEANLKKEENKFMKKVVRQQKEAKQRHIPFKGKNQDNRIVVFKNKERGELHIDKEILLG